MNLILQSYRNKPLNMMLHVGLLLTLNGDYDLLGLTHYRFTNCKLLSRSLLSRHDSSNAMG